MKKSSKVYYNGVPIKEIKVESQEEFKRRALEEIVKKWRKEDSSDFYEFYFDCLLIWCKKHNKLPNEMNNSDMNKFLNHFYSSVSTYVDWSYEEYDDC